MCKSSRRISLLVLFSSILLSCAEDKTPGDISKENTEEAVTENSICDLFSMEELNKLMGVEFKESTQTLHTVNPSAGSYVSQCGYYTNKGLQHIAVLVRHFKVTTFPQTAEEFLAASKVGDAEMDQELDKAMKTHIKVEGLGDAAFFYSLWESNSLVVHWDKSYEMIISMYDFNLDEPTMEKVKQVAIAVQKLFH